MTDETIDHLSHLSNQIKLLQSANTSFPLLLHALSCTCLPPLLLTNLKSLLNRQQIFSLSKAQLGARSQKLSSPNKLAEDTFFETPGAWHLELSAVHGW